MACSFSFLYEKKENAASGLSRKKKKSLGGTKNRARVGTGRPVTEPYQEEKCFALAKTQGLRERVWNEKEASIADYTGRVQIFLRSKERRSQKEAEAPGSGGQED